MTLAVNLRQQLSGSDFKELGICNWGLGVYRFRV